MTPEEHFRRMRHDEVWNLRTPPRPAASQARTASGAGSRRTQIWTTAVVAAAVVAVAGVAIAVAPARGGVPAGPGGAAVTSAEPSLAQRTSAPVPAQVEPSAGAADAQPSAAPAASQAATMHAGRPAYEFVAADSADIARGQRVVACLHAEGVRYVDLAAPDAEGIRYLEFGGTGNDQQSISLGLQYSDACIAAAER